MNDLYRKFLFYNAYPTYPLAFIATGDGNVSLVDISGNTGSYELQIVMWSNSGEEKNTNLIVTLKC